eukprot:1867545-Amphidinium_carterae.1
MQESVLAKAVGIYRLEAKSMEKEIKWTAAHKATTMKSNTTIRPRQNGWVAAAERGSYSQPEYTFQ